MSSLKADFEAQAEFNSDPDPTPPSSVDATFTNTQDEDVDEFASNQSSRWQITDGALSGTDGRKITHDTTPPNARRAIIGYVTGLGATTITRWRIRVENCEVNANAGGELSGRVRIYNAPTNSEQPPVNLDISVMNMNGPEDGTATFDVESPWYNASGTLQLQDFNGEADTWDNSNKFFVSIVMRRISVLVDNGCYIDLPDASDIILEYETSEVSYSVARVAEANSVTRIAGGQGLRLYADCVGVKAPDANYSVASGEPLLNPPDILRHMLVERAGFLTADIDSTTWDAAETEMASAESGFVSSDYSSAFENIVGQICYENRCQLVFEEENGGTKAKLLVAEKQAADHFVWTRSGREITQWQSAVEDTRELESIFTRWRWFSEPNRALIDQGFSNPEVQFERAVQVNPTTSDLTDITTTSMGLAEDRTGARESRAHFLVSPRTDAWADEVAEYYVSESKRVPAATVGILGIPWSESYDLELGDVIEAQLDGWPDKRSLRLLGYSKDWSTGLVDIVAIEVNGQEPP
jgi:hypothetical protein